MVQADNGARHAKNELRRQKFQPGSRPTVGARSAQTIHNNLRGKNTCSAVPRIGNLACPLVGVSKTLERRLARRWCHTKK